MTLATTILGRLSITALVVLLGHSALTRLVSAGLAVTPEEEAAATASQTYLCKPSEDVTRLVSRIARRDEALDDREAAVALRERDVDVARAEIVALLAELEAAEARLAERMAASSTAAEDDVARLVSVYEGMKPKDAASLFETMAPDFAAGFLTRMRPDASAAIFTELSPDIAYALSVTMAGRNADAATE